MSEEREKPGFTRDEVAARYEVLRDGRVFSISHDWRGYGRREMQHTLNADGYPSVRLTFGAKRKRIAVHRLVAAFYLPERPSASHEIRHLDGNQMNPDASNLAWGTPAENAADRDAHGRTQRGDRHWKAKVTAEQIPVIRKLAEDGVPFRKIGAEYGISSRQVKAIATRENWAHV